MMKSIPDNNRTQQGFTLIESLLTLFILTIGLLGVAGMQIEGLRSGGLAMQRTAVVVKVQEMMERIRATDQDTLTAYIDVIKATSAADKSCNNGTKVCTVTEMAQHDLFMWDRDLQGLLPDATPGGTVTVDVNNNNYVTVSVGWNDHGKPYSYSITSLISYSNY